MLKTGLLVPLQHQRGAKQVTPATASILGGEICTPVLAPLPTARPHHVRSMVIAWVTSVVTLKCRGLAGAIARMKRRTAQIPASNATVDALPELISVYTQLRPLFLAARSRCLLNALVLSEFLSIYGMRAECVFGVHARPFGAHCWLERGHLVLNDTVERVRRFTPILRV
jgi:hypothetical protein